MLFLDGDLADAFDGVEGGNDRLNGFWDIDHVVWGSKYLRIVAQRENLDSL